MKRWVIKQPGTNVLIANLSKELNINPILTSLLVQRGINTYAQAKDFFRPSLSNLHDPFLMKDMDIAVNRIEKAIAQKEKVLIYGDYDVDGTTAVALVYTFFKHIFSDILFYIPDRNTEGYGVSAKGIDWAKSNGVTLIIALDCGIKSIDKIDYAKKMGIDFIVCDHHRPGNEMPHAVAILDPKRADCNYPYDELCGCGVGFKLVQAFALKNNIPFDEVAQYLDLVAISIAADIVPVTGENRILTYYGLKKINENPRPGIKAIIELSGLKRELTVSDIVFTIAPRINAAGRMEHGKHAVELLITNNPVSAKEAGAFVNDRNIERKDADKETTEQAIELIKLLPDYQNRKSTVVYKQGWNKGVIGIVASRLIDKYYYRPTIVLTHSNGQVAGSARSVKNFDVYNAIEACSDLLDQFGGHMYAAGLTMQPEKVEAFIQRFEQVVSSTIEDRMLTREIEIDMAVNLNEITVKFYNVLKQFAPFGPGNMAPVFLSENVRDSGRGKTVGADGSHLKLSLVQGNAAKQIDGIAFQMGDFFQHIRNGNHFDACYHIEENYYNNVPSLQLNIKDMKTAEVKVSAANV